MRASWIICLCVVKLALCIEHDFKGFDDSILFGINWPGSTDDQNLVDGDVQKVEVGTNIKAIII